MCLVNVQAASTPQLDEFGLIRMQEWQGIRGRHDWFSSAKDWLVRSYTETNGWCASVPLIEHRRTTGLHHNVRNVPACVCPILKVQAIDELQICHGPSNMNAHDILHGLSDEQMRRYLTDGYLVLKSGLPQDVHDHVGDRCEEIFSTTGNPGNEILEMNPALWLVFADPVVKGALSSILGDGYFMVDRRPGET